METQLHLQTRGSTQEGENRTNVVHPPHTLTIARNKHDTRSSRPTNHCASLHRSYLVMVGSSVVVYSAATSEPVGECKHDVRVNSACFSGGGGGGGKVVATCGDDKTIRLFRADGGTLLVSLVTATSSCSILVEFFLGMFICLTVGYLSFFVHRTVPVSVSDCRGLGSLLSLRAKGDARSGHPPRHGCSMPTF